MTYDAPTGYAEALSSDDSDIDFFVSVGVNIDATAADDITSVTGDFLEMTNTAQIVDANYSMTEWMATFEADGIPSSPSARMLAPPITAVSYPPEVSIWSSSISDQDGNIDWTFRVDLSQAHTSAITVYTYDSNILEAEISYYLSGALVGSKPCEAESGRVKVTDAMEYDRIDVHVTKLERPFHHVKIAEMEFGASIAYHKKNLTGTLSVIQESDPLMISMPLYELDFNIMNVLGEFDPDNPSGVFNTLQIDYPVEVAFTVYNGDKSYTIPMGRFVIAERVADNTTLKISAYDSRVTLRDNFTSLSLSSSESLGDTIVGLFADLHIPYEIDDTLFTMYPDSDHTFDENSDLLTCMLYIEQYYGIMLVPQRNGTLYVTATRPQDTYGMLDPVRMLTYPLPSSFRAYNYISVSYTEGNTTKTYIADLRTGASQAKAQLGISNPLVKSLAKAQELAQKVISRIYRAQVETEFRSDPTIDIGDEVTLEGKWSSDGTAYRVIYQETRYDGDLISKMKTVK